MAKSNKPIVWGPFAAGGTVTALAMPAVILLTLLAALGHVPSGLEYDALRAFLAGWTGKLLAAVLLILSLWSSAHRLRITCHDFGARRDGAIAASVYLTAAFGTLAAAYYLFAL